MSRSFEHSGMNKKIHSLFDPLSNFVQNSNISIFFMCFISWFKIYCKEIWLKSQFSNTLFQVIKTGKRKLFYRNNKMFVYYYCFGYIKLEEHKFFIKEKLNANSNFLRLILHEVNFSKFVHDAFFVNSSEFWFSYPLKKIKIFDQ